MQAVWQEGLPCNHDNNRACVKPWGFVQAEIWMMKRLRPSPEITIWELGRGGQPAMGAEMKRGKRKNSRRVQPDGCQKEILRRERANGECSWGVRWRPGDIIKGHYWGVQAPALQAWADRRTEVRKWGRSHQHLLGDGVIWRRMEKQWQLERDGGPRGIFLCEIGMILSHAC